MTEMFGDDPEQDYTVVAYVYVKGFGKRRHADKTLSRAKWALVRTFGGSGMVKVDLVAVLRGDENRLDEDGIPPPPEIPVDE